MFFLFLISLFDSQQHEMPTVYVFYNLLKFKLSCVPQKSNELDQYFVFISAKALLDVKISLNELHLEL